MLQWRICVQLLLLTGCVAPLCRAQLTTEQKVSDFRQMVAFYEYSYAPAPWKQQVFGFDLKDTAPWVNRIQRSRDDLEFYEICYEYVSSLRDSHSQYHMPSDWSASLGFSVDNYDAGLGSDFQPATGRILIDSIDRRQLPEDRFPFQVGDELLAVDSIPVEAWIERLSKWAASSNLRSKRSMAAQAIVKRAQAGTAVVAAFPRAPLETGDSAVVQIRRRTGTVETYTVPWRKAGGPGPDEGPPPEMRVGAMNGGAAAASASVQAAGSLQPGFVLPPGFEQRLGKRGDFFFSGVFPAEGLRVGYIRIPVFAPMTQGAPPAPEPVGIAQFASEIAYLESATEALVIDIMHNPGGSPTYMDGLYSHISPTPYHQLHVAWKPNLYVLGEAYFELAAAEARGADAATLAFYRNMFSQVEAALAQGADLTPPFPVIGITAMRDPGMDAQGNIVAYSKPIVLLTDDQSVSAADAFAAQFQDNRRGLIFGVRTNGGGGNVVQFPAGVHSGGLARAENNLMVRRQFVNIPGYPATRYFENTGVHPDIVADLMTTENLLSQGAVFSRAIVAAVLRYAREQSAN